MAKRKSVKRKVSKNKIIKKVPKWRAVPLKGSFMVMSILGFLLSYYYVYSISVNFGIACMLVFVIMFVASLVSMTKAPIQESGMR